MTDDKKPTKTTAKSDANEVEVTLDRDMQVAGKDKKKGDKITVTKATAAWMKHLPKLEEGKA